MPLQLVFTLAFTSRRGSPDLTGRVPGPEDADNAESIAANVPGVREVVDQLELGS